jgi:hypothetical protein
MPSQRDATTGRPACALWTVPLVVDPKSQRDATTGRPACSASIGFATTLLTAGVRAVNLEAGDGDRAIEEERAAGVVVE